MRFNSTPEMLELEKQFKPYIDKDGLFRPNTPESAKEAEKKYIKLVNDIYDNYQKMYCE